MIISGKGLKGLIEQSVVETIQKMEGERIKLIPKELDPNKYYILLVPMDVDIESIKKALEDYRGLINLVVLQADHVKLLELGK